MGYDVTNPERYEYENNYGDGFRGFLDCIKPDLKLIREFMRLCMGQYTAKLREKKMSISKWIQEKEAEKEAAVLYGDEKKEEEETKEQPNASMKKAAEGEGATKEPFDVVSWYGGKCALTQATAGTTGVPIMAEHVTRKDGGCSFRVSVLKRHAYNITYRPRYTAGDAVRDQLLLSEEGGDGPGNTIHLHSSLRSLWEQSRVVLRPYPALKLATESEASAIPWRSSF